MKDSLVPLNVNPKQSRISKHLVHFKTLCLLLPPWPNNVVIFSLLCSCPEFLRAPSLGHLYHPWLWTVSWSQSILLNMLQSRPFFLCSCAVMFTFNFICLTINNFQNALAQTRPWARIRSRNMFNSFFSHSDPQVQYLPKISLCIDILSPQFKHRYLNMPSCLKWSCNLYKDSDIKN